MRELPPMRLRGLVLAVASSVALGCGGRVSTDEASATVSSPTLISSPMLAIAESGLYWFDRGDLKKAPRGGGEAVTLASTSGGGTLAINATEAFWFENTTGPAVMQMPLGGGPPKFLARATYVTDFATDDAHVYFGRFSDDGTTGELAEATLATGATRAVVSQVSPVSLALDGNTIFGTSCVAGIPGDRVWRVDESGGPLVVLVHDAYCPIALATNGGFVYFVDSLDKKTGEHLALWRVPKDGGAADQLAPIDGGGFVTDGTNAYAFQAGALMRIPVDKTPPTKLADAAWWYGLALDDAHVYWTHPDASGAIVLESAPK